MEITDLMINDLVTISSVNGDKYCVVTAINNGDKKIQVKNIKNNAEDVYHIDSLKPIKITKDILKLNDDSWDIKDSILATVFINSNAYGGTIKYVHDLQHILRLCGLTKIANKLKISA